jgi:hypothetical protein
MLAQDCRRVRLSSCWLLSLVMSVSCSSSRVSDSSSSSDARFVTIATVDGEPVTAAELELATGSLRVVAKSDVRDSGLRLAIRRKVQQLVMRELGLVSDVSYRGFLLDLSRENERRRTAIAMGERIYGPQELHERTYFEYVLSIGAIRLKERATTLVPSKREPEHQSSSFRRVDEVYDQYTGERVAEARVEIYMKPE